MSKMAELDDEIRQQIAACGSLKALGELLTRVKQMSGWEVYKSLFANRCVDFLEM